MLPGHTSFDADAAVYVFPKSCLVRTRHDMQHGKGQQSNDREHAQVDGNHLLPDSDLVTAWVPLCALLRSEVVP